MMAEMAIMYRAMLNEQLLNTTLAVEGLSPTPVHSQLAYTMEPCQMAAYGIKEAIIFIVFDRSSESSALLMSEHPKQTMVDTIPAYLEDEKNAQQIMICPKIASPQSQKNTSRQNGLEQLFTLMRRIAQAAKDTRVLIMVKWSHHEIQYGASVIPIIRIDSFAPDSFSFTKRNTVLQIGGIQAKRRKRGNKPANAGSNGSAIATSVGMGQYIKVTYASVLSTIC